HDETLECTPGDPEGNYIMFDQATSARLPNNRKFSKCSIASIAQVLHVVNESLHDKENCFLAQTKKANLTRCNKGSQVCIDGSCEGSLCLLHGYEDCQSSGPSYSAEKLCNVFCKLTAQTKKANLTRCNKGSQVCIDGSCEGSLCLLHGYEDCQSSGPSYSAEKLCNVFCKLTAGDKACVDPCEEPKLQLLCGVARPRGAPCNGNMGYCDVYKRCRAVNEGGALRRLQSIFFGTGRISRWIQQSQFARSTEVEDAWRIPVELIFSSVRRRLNLFVEHFEPLSYRPVDVHRSHLRAKRSISSGKHVYLQFRGHNSYVYGALLDGVFEGGIETRWGHFYVDRAAKHFNHLTAFHSVLYSAADVKFPAAGKSPHRWCGVTGETERWMNKVVEAQSRRQAHHDNDSVCAPGGEEGNFIMFPSATSGTRHNNHLFSSCSVGNISAILVPLFEGKSSRENCFQPDRGPICGNTMVEGNETCDCGYTESECNDECCYARQNDDNKEGCSLKPNAKC
ncbi:kuzbanian, putative, partial [Ixodes scapularis]